MREARSLHTDWGMLNFDISDVSDDFNFDDEPTSVIPRETMRELIYGEGHAPTGPDRATRDLGPIEHAIYESPLVVIVSV